MVAAGEVAVRDPTLLCPGSVVGGRLLRSGHRVVRDPVHRALPAGAVRFRGRRRPLGAARPGVRDPSRHRPLPALLPYVSRPGNGVRRTCVALDLWAVRYVAVLSLELLAVRDRELSLIHISEPT